MTAIARKVVFVSAVVLIGGAAALAACGRSIPRSLRVLAQADSGPATQGDGSFPGADGSGGGSDGSNLDIGLGAMDAQGPPDSGDPCADLNQCCMTLMGGLQMRCERVVMRGNAMACERTLGMVQRFGLCGGDGGLPPPMGDGGGMRRRDGGGGGFDVGDFDAAALGPNCAALFSCCTMIPGRFQQQCVNAATNGNEMLCSQVIQGLGAAGIMCDEDAG